MIKRGGGGTQAHPMDKNLPKEDRDRCATPRVAKGIKKMYRKKQREWNKKLIRNFL